MSKILFDEQPIVISKELARLIGLNESIVLQQMHYWIEINKKANKNYIQGKYWVYNSMKNWHEENFYFWSFETVKRTIAKLEKLNLIETSEFNKNPYDRTKWYSINYDVLESLNKTQENPIGSKCSNGAEHEYRVGQNDPIDKNSLTQPIPEITKEITTKEEEERIAEKRYFEPTYEEPEVTLEPEVINTYKENFKPTITQAEKHALIELQFLYGVLLLTKAIIVTAEKGGKSISYIRAVMDDWSMRGIKTPDQAEEHLQKWKDTNNKARSGREKAIEHRAKNSPTKTYKQNDIPQMRNFEEREYTEEFFRSLYPKE